jgi:hypothetical protein
MSRHFLGTYYKNGFSKGFRRVKQAQLSLRKPLSVKQRKKLTSFWAKSALNTDHLPNLTNLHNT